jgi:serine/threonine protein kinase
MGEPTLRQIGGYQLVGTLGKGGMGVVYRALDNIGRTVAIKMLHGTYAEDKDLLKRFYREAQSTGSLQHKNIVTVHALGDQDGTPYLVMEFLDGKNLADLVLDRPLMSLVEKLGIIVQVCDGLNYAHQRDLIHRDIKPANIIVLKDGVVKIVDFGIVRVGAGESITHTGQLIGSMYYMSPEQINGGHIDFRSDLFSTGVMLYQLLTGVRPFEGPDAASTFMKITLDPVPPLSKYLAEYPAGLEEIVSKSLAKDPNERYQSAEELAFDLSHIQDNLKRGMSDEFLKLATDAIRREEWEVAKNNLQEILKLDRQHSRAYELLREVRQSVQNQQRSGQIKQLRSQAEVAAAGRQYDEALACVDAALKIAPTDPELGSLRQEIEQAMSKGKALRESLQRGEAALYAGDLDEAENAIRAALQVDANNTDARALRATLDKELAERSNRARVLSYINEARQQISNRDFTFALNLLEQARTLDPSDSNVRELHSWAKRGQEQERRRKEIEQIEHEIRQAIRNEDFLLATELCDSAPARFADEPSLLNLKGVAENQQKIRKKRRFVEEQSILARRRVDEGSYEGAIQVLQSALQQYPGEPNLEALLGIIRIELDRTRKEQELEERKRAELQAAAVDPKIKLAIEAVNLLRRALDSGESVNALAPLAESLREITTEVDMDGQLAFDCNSVLLAFEARQKKSERDSREIEELKRSVETSTSFGDMTALAERARSIAESHAKDDHIRNTYSQISQFVKDTRSRRDAAVTRASQLLASMAYAEDLTSLLAMQKEMEEIGSYWPAELRISSFIEQAAGQVQEAREAKARILAELEQIEASFGSTISRGTISLQINQATRRSAECLQDDEIGAKLERVRRVGEESLSRLDAACSELKELFSAVSAAMSLEEIEGSCTAARSVSSSNPGVEEIDNLVARVIRRAEERRKSHRKVTDTLASLLLSVEKAEDRGELDLIGRRCEDLAKEWPRDRLASNYIEQVRAKVKERLSNLAKIAAELPETAAEPSEAVVEPREGLEPHEIAVELREAAPEPRETVVKPPEITVEGRLKDRADAGGKSGHPLSSETILLPAVELKEAPREAVRQRAEVGPRGQRLGKGSRRSALMLSGCLVLVGLIASAAWFLPRTIHLHVVPADQSVVVDGRECSAPCVIKLTPGEHRVEARRSGFEDLRQTIRIPVLGADLPTLSMKEVAPAKADLEPPKPTTVAPSEPPKVSQPAKLLIQASVPGASVYVDGRLAGHTAASGRLMVDTFDGPHEVKVEKQGFRSIIKPATADPKAGVVAIAFKLDALPVGEKAADAKVTPPIVAPTVAQPRNPVPGTVIGPATPPPPAPSPAPVAKLTVTPEKIVEGQAVILAWQTENANDVSIEGIGAVGKSDSRQVSPERSTNYRLIAKGSGGKEVEASVRVEVTPANKMAPANLQGAELQAIKLALQRYKDAYESESLDDMKKAWPGMTRPQEKTLKEAFNSFNAIHISLNCQDEDVHISDDNAWVNCHQASTYTQRGKKQQPEASKPVRIALRKHEGIWAVSSVESK